MQFDPKLHDYRVYLQKVNENVENSLNEINENADEMDNVDEFIENVPNEYTDLSGDELYNEALSTSTNSESEHSGNLFEIKEVYQRFGEPSVEKFVVEPRSIESYMDLQDDNQTESTPNENEHGSSDYYMHSWQRFNQDFMKMQEELKKAHETIKSLKEEYKKELIEWNEMNQARSKLIENKDKEFDAYKGLCEQKINELTEKLAAKDEEYAFAIEQAKRNKFCLACDTPTLLTDIYVCNKNCHQRYW